jgi:nitric oxide reductase NorE protein
MEKITINKPSALYPPGGILIWIIVFVELVTFGMALIVFEIDFRKNHELFLASQNLLHKGFGLVNTLVLITSGYFMATAIFNIQRGKIKQASGYLLLTIGGGILFLFIKGWEYIDKLQSGLTLRFDEFFTYYWLLTGFHFIHVLVGVALLLGLWIGLKKGTYSQTNFEDIETGGIFWHMVDLIWVLLFPILYLIN